MMSKERELLRRVVDIIEENPTQADQYAIQLIEDFLAKPEPEQEPTHIAFNRGLLMGQDNMKREIEIISKYKEELLQEKEYLTELLLKAEDEISLLKNNLWSNK